MAGNTTMPLRMLQRACSWDNSTIADWRARRSCVRIMSMLAFAARASFLFLYCRFLCDQGRAAEFPAPVEGDYLVADFKFTTGETLPELKLHYTTIGAPARNAAGVVTNAVLIMHGT